LTYCLQNGQQQDAEVFFRLFLEALDEELLALLASTSVHKPADAPQAEERGVSQSGQTDVGKQGIMVRQLLRLFELS
jgi:hypothetical protein